MRAKVWGCRGSLASPGADTVRYGGNTSCLEVRSSDGQLIVVDAGTGIRDLGVALGADRPDRIDILFGHLHLDHVEGLGFFGPIWDPDCEIHLWGPPTPERSLREDITRLMSPPLFPVHLDEVPSKLFFHDVTRMEWELGSARITADPIIHRGPAVGFRLEDGGSTIAYMSDHEPAIGVDLLENVPPEWVSGYGLAQGADVLFHDAQYTEEEYASRVGWGHSTVDHMMAFGRLTGVGKLYMFHHDPLHTDQKLQEMLVAARERWQPYPDTLALAYEGMEISLGERSPVMQKR